VQRERKQCDRMKEWETEGESGRVIDWEGERATEWKWKSWEYVGFQKFGIPHLPLKIFTSTFAHATSDTLTQLPWCQVGVMNQRCQQNIIQMKNWNCLVETDSSYTSIVTSCTSIILSYSDFSLEKKTKIAFIHDNCHSFFCPLCGLHKP